MGRTSILIAREMVTHLLHQALLLPSSIVIREVHIDPANPYIKVVIEGLDVMSVPESEIVYQNIRTEDGRIINRVETIRPTGRGL